jgi:spore coat protein U-like protein
VILRTVPRDWTDHCHYYYHTITVGDAHAVFGNNQSATTPALSIISSTRTLPVGDATRLFSRYQKINILSFGDMTDLETLTWFTSFIRISCSSAVTSTLAITTSSPTKAPGTVTSRMCGSFFIFTLLIAALASDLCVFCLIENLLDIDSA